MRNLARILPLKFQLPEKFQCFSAVDGSIKFTFYETQTASSLKEIIKPSPITRSLVSETEFLGLPKFLATGIYRNTHIFAFQVLRECSSWASKNGAVQIFFLTPTRNMFAGKFLK